MPNIKLKKEFYEKFRDDLLLVAKYIGNFTKPLDNNQLKDVWSFIEQALINQQKEIEKKIEEDFGSLWDDIQVVDYPEEAKQDILMWLREFVIPTIREETIKEIEKRLKLNTNQLKEISKFTILEVLRELKGGKKK